MTQESLSPDARTTIQLFIVDDLEVDEIAPRLGCEEADVRRLLVEARKELKAA